MGRFHLTNQVDLKMVGSFLHIALGRTANWHLITQADHMKLISSLPIIQVDHKKVDNFPHTIRLDPRMGHHFLTTLADFQTAIFHQCITDHTHSTSDLRIT